MYDYVAKCNVFSHREKDGIMVKIADDIDSEAEIIRTHHADEQLSSIM